MVTPIALLTDGAMDPSRPETSSVRCGVGADDVPAITGGDADAAPGALSVAPVDRGHPVEQTDTNATVVVGENIDGARDRMASAGHGAPAPRIAWGDDVPLVLPLRDTHAPKPRRSRDGRVAWTSGRREDPVASASGSRFHPGTPVAHVRAHLAASARAAIERDLCVDLSRERGGFLVGTVERQREGSLVVDVRAAIPADGAEGGASWWQLTPRAWGHASSVLERCHPGLIIVGWYHSHPGLGCFFSKTDRETQRHVFPNRWNVAVVGDPVAPRNLRNLRGTREAVPAGAMPFRWFLGPDAVPLASPEGYDDVPASLLTFMRGVPALSAPRWRRPRMHRRRDR